MKFIHILILLVICIGLHNAGAQSFKDEPFPQPVSKKYTVKGNESDLEMKKLVTDRDDNVYALTDQGLFIIIENYLVPDRRYRPLADTIPVDITIQDEIGILYYLYDDHYLSNAHAGKPYGTFDESKYSIIAVNNRGEVFLAGGKNYSIASTNQPTKEQWTEEILQVKSYQGDFFIQTASGIYQYQKGDFNQVADDSSILAWTFGDDQLFISKEKGVYSVATENWNTTSDIYTKLPVIPATSLTFFDDTLWAASENGIYSTADFENYRYYASKRWLQNNNVLDITVDSDGNVFALTKSGISEVHFRQMTLKEKADYFHERIRKRHLRYGLIGEVRLQEPGDLTTMEMVDTDNDGLWTSFYLGSEVFRYAATKNQEAKRNAMESFEAFERLLSINQLEGFPSRTFERTGYKVSDHERWRQSPEEGWEWKGHTSSDEFVAYLWVAGVINRYLDLTKNEKQRVSDFIDQIMMHLIRNDYYFVDIDGEPTLWGRWNPEYINWYPKTIGDRKLGSTTITAGLQLAYQLTGKEIYKDEMNRLFEEHGYLENIKIPIDTIDYTPGYTYEGHNMGMGGWNHSDDEMAFLTYWVLYHYALNDDLKQTYADVISDHWEIEKPERNSLWNLIAYSTSGDIDLESVKWHLREFQLDMIRWDITNSHRNDLDYLGSNFRGQTISEVLPPGERRTVRYNANPFDLDGGRGGMRSLAGDEFLLPYWMGRYLDVIIPTND